MIVAVMLTHDYIQFCLATRADVSLSQSFIQRVNSVSHADIFVLLKILLGVHGNGLTHQVWMKPQSSVIEVGSL